MKIVVVGSGKVGYTLTKELSQEGHDVSLIDKELSVLEQAQGLLDIMVVHGNGATLETQREAGVAHSDLLIAATSADEMNLLCCILARRLGCRHTIARVRNPEYTAQTQFLREELGLSMTINPEQAAAREIFRILQFPSFLKRDSFARGRVEIVELMVSPGGKLDNVRFDQLLDVTKVKILICAVERGDEVFIPKGNFVLRAGDKITVTAARRDLARLIVGLGIVNRRVKNVMLIGGSRIAAYLMLELLKSKIGVKLIELDPVRAEQLADRFPDALIINGNGSEQGLLEEEGVCRMDAVVTLTGIDEENLVISMYAKHIGVAKTVTKINRMEYGMVFRDMGIDSVVSPKMLTANEILRYVRAVENTTGGSVVTLHRIMNDRVEALEFRVTADMRGLGVPLKSLQLRPDVLIGCIMRGNDVIIPAGNDCLCAGDSAVIIASPELALGDLNDIFTGEPRQ